MKVLKVDPVLRLKPQEPPEKEKKELTLVSYYGSAGTQRSIVLAEGDIDGHRDDCGDLPFEVVDQVSSSTLTTMIESLPTTYNWVLGQVSYGYDQTGLAFIGYRETENYKEKLASYQEDLNKWKQEKLAFQEARKRNKTKGKVQYTTYSRTKYVCTCGAHVELTEDDVEYVDVGQDLNCPQCGLSFSTAGLRWTTKKKRIQND